MMVEFYNQIPIHRLRDDVIPIRPERLQGLGDRVIDGSSGVPAHNVGVGDVDGEGDGHFRLQQGISVRASIEKMIFEGEGLDR